MKKFVSMSNYSFTFDKNERRILTAFCNQLLKSLGNDEKYYNEIRAFEAIITKIKSGEEQIKLTKIELQVLKENLSRNISINKKELDKVWFLKRWFIKSYIMQYEKIYDEHFKG